VSAIPPVEPTRPAHGIRRVTAPGRDDERRERPSQERREPEPEEREDDGLPHVDVRA